MATEKREDGLLFAVAGATRYGKTSWYKQQIADAPRALIRDPRGEFVNEKGYQVARTIPELARLLREIGKGEGRVAFWGDDSDFPAFCELAYLWGQLWPAVIVAEEISDVTSPGKAPREWGGLIRKGLFYGNHIYSITQRPQECDKTVWGNASVIHCHGFILPNDQAYMAERMGVEVADIAALDKLDYLERWAGETEIRRGKVSF